MIDPTLSPLPLTRGYGMGTYALLQIDVTNLIVFTCVGEGGGKANLSLKTVFEVYIQQSFPQPNIGTDKS